MRQSILQMHDNLTLRNNIKIFGDGTQPIVFAHGFGCDQHMWRYITPAFETDFKIILFDLVGSGKSDNSAYDFEKYSSLLGYADDLIEICNDIQLQKIIFVGHSVSSMIGVLAEIKRPDLFEKLVLIGPSPCYINKNGYVGGFTRQDIDELVETLESNFIGWSSYITPVIIGNTEMPEYSEELKHSFCNMDPKIAKHFAKVTFLGDNREDLQKVTTPSLIIQCNPDAIAPVEVGEFVHKNMPKSSFALLDISGHCPHLTAPNLVISSVQSFLTSEI